MIIKYCTFCFTSTWNLHLCPSLLIFSWLIHLHCRNAYVHQFSLVHDRIAKLNVYVIRTDSVPNELNVYGMLIQIGASSWVGANAPLILVAMFLYSCWFGCFIECVMKRLFLCCVHVCKLLSTRILHASSKSLLSLLSWRHNFCPSYSRKFVFTTFYAAGISVK